MMRSVELIDGQARIPLGDRTGYIFPEISKNQPMPDYKYIDYYIDEHPLSKFKTAISNAFKVPVCFIPNSLMLSFSKQSNVTYIFRVPANYSVLATLISGRVKFYVFEK